MRDGRVLMSIYAGLNDPRSGNFETKQFLSTLCGKQNLASRQKILGSLIETTKRYPGGAIMKWELALGYWSLGLDHTIRRYHSDIGPPWHNLREIQSVLMLPEYRMEANNSLDSRHAEDDMPKLLNQPAKSIVVCNVGCGDPGQNADIVLHWLFHNAFAANSKLGTALMPNVVRGLTRGNSKKFPKNFRNLIYHILIVHIKRHRESLMHCAWTSRPVRATQINVAVDFHSLVSEVGEYTGSVWT